MAVGALITALFSGCAGGYVSTGGYVEPLGFSDPYAYEPYVPAPDIYVFGGPRYPYHYHAHEFSRRGWESRRGFRDYPHVGRSPGPVHGSGHGSFHDRHH